MGTRVFQCQRERDRVRIFSYRDDVAVRVADVDRAIDAFRLHAAILDGCYSSEATPPQEVCDFFDRLLGSWIVGAAQSVFQLDPGSDDHPLTEALSEGLISEREMFAPNIAAFSVAAGQTKPTILVTRTPRWSAQAMTLPVLITGVGAIAGPLVNKGRPCAACLERSLDVAGIHREPAQSEGAWPLLADRLLDGLLVKPLITYFESYTFFRTVLDEAPVQNQAIRFPQCVDCDFNYRAYSKRLVKDEGPRARAALTKRGILA